MPRPGRPALAPEERKQDTIAVRVTPDEYARLAAIAKERGMTLSDLTRTLYEHLLQPTRRATWGR